MTLLSLIAERLNVASHCRRRDFLSIKGRCCFSRCLSWRWHKWRFAFPFVFHWNSHAELTNTVNFPMVDADDWSQPIGKLCIAHPGERKVHLSSLESFWKLRIGKDLCKSQKMKISTFNIFECLCAMCFQITLHHRAPLIVLKPLQGDRHWWTFMHFNQS